MGFFMKVFASIVCLTLVLGAVAHHHGVFKDLKAKAEYVYHYEEKSLELLKENKALRMKLNEAEAVVARLVNENEHQGLKREIASVAPMNHNDLVQQEAYQWSAEKLKDTGAQSLARREFEKSAQFYNTYLSLFPQDQGVNAQALFEAGVAAYESGNHYDWAIKHFEKIVTNHKSSRLHRGAKLWLALSHYQMGNTQEFLEVCKDFKNKYRNSEEWKIVSKYYDSIMSKHQNGSI